MSSSRDARVYEFLTWHCVYLFLLKSSKSLKTGDNLSWPPEVRETEHWSSLAVGLQYGGMYVPHRRPRDGDGTTVSRSYLAVTCDWEAKRWNGCLVPAWLYLLGVVLSPVSEDVSEWVNSGVGRKSMPPMRSAAPRLISCHL